MTIYYELTQGTAEWLQLKSGKISASRVEPLMAVRGLGEAAKTYAVELTAEVLLDQPTFVPITFAMEHGSEYEPYAREIYENNRSVSVQQVGGIEHDGLWFSPDGLVDDDGLIEIKCPQPKQHLMILLSDDIDKRYIAQMQFGMMVSDRKWCDFVSFHPDFPDHLKVKVIRVERDEKYISLMRERIAEFKELLISINDKLKNNE
jgi:putative phage-type endonuclease